jgi:hypothetical protein
MMWVRLVKWTQRSVWGITANGDYHVSDVVSMIHQDLDHSHVLKLFFSHLKNQIAKLDQDYKKHGISYHSIFPDLRDEKYGDYERACNSRHST